MKPTSYGKQNTTKLQGLMTESATGRSKYGAVKTEVDGIRFDSKLEAARYVSLRMLAQADEITGLELQPSYDLIVNAVLVCRYVADFRYTTRAGKLIVEDAKGVKTPAYRLKKKLMKAIHNIEVREV